MGKNLYIINLRNYLLLFIRKKKEQHLIFFVYETYLFVGFKKRHVHGQLKKKINYWAIIFMVIVIACVKIKITTRVGIMSCLVCFELSDRSST